MTRPSRGERESATTIRQIGSLRPPTRVSLIRTAIGADRLATLAHHGLQIGHLALAELLHELLHLSELLDELVDVLDRRARPARDSQPPRALDEVGPAALQRRHREDDRLDAVELALVDLDVLQRRALK